MERTASPEARAFIRSFEALRLKAYPDPGTGGDPWTIGYGHTGRHVVPGLEITEAEANELFDGDVMIAEDGVNQLVKVPLTTGQFDALVSFAFNVGLDIDTDDVAEGLGDSTLLKKLNRGDYAGAAAEFPKWNRAGGKIMNGLIRRRAAEQQMFLRT